MTSRVIFTIPYFSFPSISNKSPYPKLIPDTSAPISYAICCSTSTPGLPVTTGKMLQWCSSCLWVMKFNIEY